MKILNLLLAIITILFFSCDDNNGKSCSVGNPIEDLNWLALEVDDMSKSGMVEYLYVTQAKYRNGTVFLFRNCCPDCLYTAFVYNCFGEVIGEVGDDIESGELKFEKVIWKPANSACNF